MDQPTSGEVFLESAAHRFGALKELGEKAIAQLADEDLIRPVDEEPNSIAILIKHLHGNMMSRWTDFLTTDGNKPWRDRDGEFELAPNEAGRSHLMALWQEGWDCLFAALLALRPEDLTESVTIRGQRLSALDAILRQLSHYACHIGQIVFIAKQTKGGDWQTLSIPRGQSESYRPRKRD